MIELSLANPLHLVVAGVATLGAWLWLAWLIEVVRFDLMPAYTWARLWLTRQAHRLERPGKVLAERASMVWPWPDSELELIRTTIAVSCAYEDIRPDDRLKLASTGEVVRVLTVAVDRIGVTAERIVGATDARGWWTF